MMQLRTYPLCAGDEGVFVHWTVGRLTHGLVKVNIPTDHPKREVFAEIIAIRHLLCDRKVFGGGLISGRGTWLKVKSEDIIRLASGDGIESMVTYDRELSAYLLFLSYEFFNMVIEPVDIDPAHELFGTYETWEIDEVRWDTRRFRYPGEVRDTALGKLLITRHAVEQFEERLAVAESFGAKCAKSALIRRLRKSVEFKRVELSEHARRDERAKYGTENAAEHWACPHSKLRMVVVRSPRTQIGKLLTCYWV